jgi:translation initiation factor IF-2
MQQRRLRLGDILDDYCPRERRITNHAIVAMIDDEVKQTRCTTCDADHEYKQARIPPQRRKKLTPADDAAEGAGRLRPTEDEAAAAEEPRTAETDAPETPEALHPPAEATAASESPEPETVESATPDDDGPVHRRLIRATLPRPEGQPPDRKEPEFTIRQPGMRGPGAHKRGHRHPRTRGTDTGSSSRFGTPRQGHGSRPPGGGSGHAPRPSGNRPGLPPGGPRGNRPGPGGRGGGRKRGR